MTDTGQEHPDDALLDLAAAYALDAIDERERTAIAAELSDAPPPIRRAFDNRVRGYRETLAAYARTTATPAPPRLRTTLMRIIAHDGDANVTTRSDGPETDPISIESARRRQRTRQAFAAAAAAVVLVAGGVAIGHQFTGPSAGPEASQVYTASDARAATIDVAGGTATVVYSRDANAAVLVMNDVAPPQPDTVYQLWLMGPGHAPTPAGTMSRADVTPSTRAFVTDIDASNSLGISIEPHGGATQPSAIVARITLA